MIFERFKTGINLSCKWRARDAVYSALKDDLLLMHGLPSVLINLAGIANVTTSWC